MGPDSGRQKLDSPQQRSGEHAPRLSFVVADFLFVKDLYDLTYHSSFSAALPTIGFEPLWLSV